MTLATWRFYSSSHRQSALSPLSPRDPGPAMRQVGPETVMPKRSSDQAK